MPATKRKPPKSQRRQGPPIEERVFKAVTEEGLNYSALSARFNSKELEKYLPRAMHSKPGLTSQVFGDAAGNAEIVFDACFGKGLEITRLAHENFGSVVSSVALMNGEGRRKARDVKILKKLARRGPAFVFTRDGKIYKSNSDEKVWGPENLCVAAKKMYKTYDPEIHDAPPPGVVLFGFNNRVRQHRGRQIVEDRIDEVMSANIGRIRQYIETHAERVCNGAAYVLDLRGDQQDPKIVCAL